MPEEVFQSFSKVKNYCNTSRVTKIWKSSNLAGGFEKETTCTEYNAVEVDCYYKTHIKPSSIRQAVRGCQQ